MSDNSMDIVSKNVVLAYEKAKSLGEVIGIVSRRSPSRIVKEENRVYVEVKPDVYYRLGLELSVGSYLLTVDIRTLKVVGLRVQSINRFDAASDLQLSSLISLEPEPEGLLTNVIVEAAPLLTEDGEPFGTAIEPQSPVVLPSKPDILSRLIGIPEEGILIGFLHSGVSPIAKGLVPLRVPRREFFKHMLIIGTTGSGKTTFVKNLMYSIMNSWSEASLVVIDAAGDYTQIIIPPPEEPHESAIFRRYLSKNKYIDWISVLVPLRKGDSDLRSFVLSYIKDKLERICREFHGSDLEVSIEGTRNFEFTYSLVTKITINNYSAYVEVIPISLSYIQIRDHLEIFPLFSRQAKVFLRNVINYLESYASGITNFTYLYRIFQDRSNDLVRVLKIHRGTLENIERALNFIASSEEVDVSIGRKIFGMPSIDTLMRKYRGPIILDLDYALIRGAHYLIANLIAYEFLRSLYTWKRSLGYGKPVIVVLDEAHRFFPSEGTSTEEVELLADFISRIARLGRSKGLGLIFSTHSPKDVHKIVIQLTNTKVIFRSEREYLEFLDVPREFIPILELAQDRVGLLRTPAIRSGYALFKTSEPLLGHYDVGRLIK